MHDKKQLLRLTLDRRQIYGFLTALTVLALVTRLMIAYLTVHYFDVSYYVSWSTGVTNDFFGAYNNIGNLDYPPLFLFPLSLTGQLLGVDLISSFEPFRMLALKGWQLLFDAACIPLFYMIFRRWNEWFGLVGAALWAIHPTMLVNAPYWGQTDSIMIFLVMLTFHLLQERRPVWSGVVMTLACLMKFQSIYFAPVFALALLCSFPLKKILQTIAAGVATAAAVFLPFMARSGWLLPLEVYFGGFGQYQSASLNAFNLYFALGLNGKPLDSPVFWGIQADWFSMAVIGLSLALLVWLWFTASEKSVWLLGFVFMQNIFLFTTRMHERYQVPVLALALAAAFYHRSKPMFAGFLGLTGVTFLNHFMLIEKVRAGENPGGWLPYYDRIGVVLSVVNLVLWAAMLAVSLYLFYRHGRLRFFDTFRATFGKRRGNSPEKGRDAADRL